MRSWHVVQEICKMKSKNEIVRVEDEIVTMYTAGAGWCFPRKNPLRDMFCDFQRVFPMETQKVFLKEKSEKHYVFLSGFP